MPPLTLVCKHVSLQPVFCCRATWFGWCCATSFVRTSLCTLPPDGCYVFSFVLLCKLAALRKYASRLVHPPPAVCSQKHSPPTYQTHQAASGTHRQGCRRAATSVETVVTGWLRSCTSQDCLSRNLLLLSAFQSRSKQFQATRYDHPF